MPGSGSNQWDGTELAKEFNTAEPPQEKFMPISYQEHWAVARAFELLSRVGLDGLYDKRADALSGGQRQRVGIARPLVQNPQLLRVDEPTASLDPRRRARSRG